MGSWVVVGSDAVYACGNHFAFPDDDCSEGTAAVSDVLYTQVDGLAHTPLHEKLREADAHEQLHRLVQETLIGVKVEGDLLCGMTVYSLDVIDDGIDSDLSGGSTCCVPELLNCGDLFDENHTFLFLKG